MQTAQRSTPSRRHQGDFLPHLKGQVLLQQSFFISEAGLEGIALSVDGKQLFVVQEETNAVLIIDIAARCERQRQPLAAMANYDAVAEHFSDRPDNKGLEVITVNPVNGHVFVVKESQPGLLIELAAECRSILSSRCLARPMASPIRKLVQTSSISPVELRPPTTACGSSAIKAGACFTTTGSRRGAATARHGD